MTDPAPTFPKPTRRLRLGFVGGGQGGLIGEVHANGARLSNRWDVVAGALSSNPAKAASSAADWLIAPERSYSDYREMAKAEAARPDGIDAVAIVTPNHLHHSVAVAFMEAGIDVICDKPVTNTLAEAQDLAAHQEESGLIFGVTYVYSAHAMVRQARAMVRAGLLGDIRQIHVEYFQEWAAQVSEDADPGRRAWRFDPAKSGLSMTTADIGTHAVHLAEFVTGRDVEELRADFHVAGKPKQMEDTAFINLRFAGGIPGVALVSQAMVGTHCGLHLRISGTKAGIEWHQEAPESLTFTPYDAPAQVISRGHSGGMDPSVVPLIRMPRGHPEALTDAWANLYLEFGIAIEARRTGQKLDPDLLAYPTLDQAVKGVAFVEAAVRSNKSGTWERISEK